MTARSCVIIPAFNEEGSIGTVVHSLKPILDTVIVVNDNSSDETGSIARAAGAMVINHATNKGYDHAINSGFMSASEQGFEHILTFDADGQHNPSDLKIMLKKLRDNQADIVIGIRKKKARWSEHILGLYANHRFGIKDPLSGLKGYHIKLFHKYGAFSKYNMIGSELSFFAASQGSPLIQMPIEIIKRQHTKPRFTGVLSGNEKILSALFKAVKLYGFKK
ncbi:MAG: glycosyltransferase family 2 protein [Candidatus Margulisbacteria bacterium]|nr:glycosyltransferase family 2 protein [Candidatus Margulisiibacteriota bacterium]